MEDHVEIGRGEKKAFLIHVEDDGEVLKADAAVPVHLLADAVNIDDDDVPEEEKGGGVNEDDDCWA